MKQSSGQFEPFSPESQNPLPQNGGGQQSMLQSKHVSPEEELHVR